MTRLAAMFAPRLAASCDCVVTERRLRRPGAAEREEEEEEAEMTVPSRAVGNKATIVHPCTAVEELLKTLRLVYLFLLIVLYAFWSLGWN